MNEPYMPVVALAPEAAAGQDTNTQPVRPTFRYDKKDGPRGGDKEVEKNERRRKEEDVSMVQTDAKDRGPSSAPDLRRGVRSA